MHDLIIIGAGPAGITAAIYAVRKRLDLLVISTDIGGQTAWSGDIQNYTGHQFITGPELTAKFEEHMLKYGIPIKEQEEVIELASSGGVITIKTDKGSYTSKAAIIASGKRSRELNVPGEKEFKNRGLTYCATCDGPLFAKKQVAVIGGGNSALDAALQLMRIASHVYLINAVGRLTGDPVMIEKIEAARDIVSVMNDTKVLAITGDRMVRSIKTESAGKGARDIPVEGVFVEIGLIPNSYFASGVAKNEHGEIKVDTHNRTNIPGVFASGDVTDVPEKQIIIAAGEGAKAALAAFRYLSRKK
jgi:alkyl hydroperoxide reductase subunit F